MIIVPKTISLTKPILIFLTVTSLYLANIILQNFNLGKVVYTFTDEGVYLYSAKLISEGLIPYKDFFLAQPSFLLYIVGLLLNSISFDMELFRLLCTLWTFSFIFPIFFTVFKFTKSSLAATLSILLLSTFSELVQWDMRSFAFRQTSLPLLAFSIFFFYVKPKPIISGLLLGLFSISLISNLLIASNLILSILFGELLITRKKIYSILKDKFQFLLTFTLIIFLGYSALLLIPNAYNNLINYQLLRPSLPLIVRFEWIKQYTLLNNWPILLFGALGSLIINKEIKLFGLFNIFSFIGIVFLGNSYYPHYLAILGVGFAISSGLLIKSFSKTSASQFIVICIVLISIFLSSYDRLKTYLIDNKTPDFFKIISILKNTPQPLFTFEPIYALYAQKDLTFQYHIADMRYFRVLNKNLSDSDYKSILERSQTILIEPFASSYLSENSLIYIHQHFRRIYNDGINQIYVKNF